MKRLTIGLFLMLLGVAFTALAIRSARTVYLTQATLWPGSWWAAWLGYHMLDWSIRFGALFTMTLILPGWVVIRRGKRNGHYRLGRRMYRQSDPAVRNAGYAGKSRRVETMVINDG